MICKAYEDAAEDIEMEDKKNWNKDELKALGSEDLESVAGGRRTLRPNELRDLDEVSGKVSMKKDSLRMSGRSILGSSGADYNISMEAICEGRLFRSCRYRNRHLGEFLKEFDLTEGRATGIHRQSLKPMKSGHTF